MLLQNFKMLGKDFSRDESGEVTIAWVVITAAIVSLSVTLLMQIGNGTQELSGKVDQEMSTREVKTTF